MESARSAENLVGDKSRPHFAHRSGYRRGPIVADSYLDVAAWHVNGDGLVAQTHPVGHGRGGATAAAGGQRVAGPALPYLDLDVGPVEHGHELDVGAVGETGVVFYQRP